MSAARFILTGMSLLDRLSQIYGTSNLQNSPSAHLETHEQTLPCGELADFLQGDWRRTESGHYLMVERNYPLVEQIGNFRLGDFDSIRKESLSLLSGDPSFHQFNPRQALFLDTETTGLAGGAGTYVFLVGVGFFSAREFRIRQFFLPDLNSERALLEGLSNLTEGEGNDQSFRYLFSFNGKSYDIQLLDNRYILSRLKRPFSRLAHLDLLYPSRSLWKGRFPDCSLQTLERNLLGLRRHDDIPSWQIPQTYFHFLRGGSYRPFSQVFDHNRRDLLALVGLACLACRLLLEPDRSLYVDPVSVARLHVRRGQLQKAAELLERSLAGAEWPECRLEMTLELGLLKRKLGRNQEALNLFHRVMQLNSRPPLAAIEEAAKILEHDARELDEALLLVKEGLSHYPGYPPLQHRLHRLRCRAEGRKWY